MREVKSTHALAKIHGPVEGQCLDTDRPSRKSRWHQVAQRKLWYPQPLCFIFGRFCFFVAVSNNSPRTVPVRLVLYHYPVSYISNRQTQSGPKRKAQLSHAT